MEPESGFTNLDPGRALRHVSTALARAEFDQESREVAARSVAWYRAYDAERFRISIG